MPDRFTPTAGILLAEATHAQAGLGTASAVLASLDAAQLAAEIEALHDDRARYMKLARLAGEVASIAEDLLVASLGPGEVAQAPSGRLAFRDMVPAGNRAIREDALVEIADELPEDLRPKPTWKLPSLTAIDSAVRGHRITAAQREQIVQRPGKVPGLRWRTLSTEDDEL